MHINGIKLPNLIECHKESVDRSFSSNARRADLLVAVGFNPRSTMPIPVMEPRSGDIFNDKITPLRGVWGRGCPLPWVETHGYQDNVPTGTRAYALCKNEVRNISINVY